MFYPLITVGVGTSSKPVDHCGVETTHLDVKIEHRWTFRNCAFHTWIFYRSVWVATMGGVQSNKYGITCLFEAYFNLYKSLY